MTVATDVTVIAPTPEAKIPLAADLRPKMRYTSTVGCPYE